MEINDDKTVKLILVGLAVLAANTFFIWGFDYPFLYCLLRNPAWEVYRQLGMLALITTALMTAWAALRGRTIHALIGVCIFVGVNNLPRLAEILLKQGGACV
jgi:hypothetical protein